MIEDLELDAVADAIEKDGYAVGATRIRQAISVIEDREKKIANIIRWLEVNQRDVFSRGLWDAIGA